MIEYIGKCVLIDKKILVVGDLHLGYEDSLNRSGVFVSRVMFNEMILYFDKVFEKIGKVKEIVLLGDVKHNFGGISEQEWGDTLRLLDYFSQKTKKIVIVKGNHDKIIEPIARKREIVVKDYYIYNEYCFLHGDKDFEEIYDRKIKVWIIGHGHPAVKLREGVKIEKYKCFLEGEYKKKKIIIAPSFIEFSEGSDPRESELCLAWNFDLNKFNVKIVGGGLDVLDFGKLKDLS